MRWFSAGDKVSLAKAFPAGFSGVSARSARLYAVGVPEDVLEPDRRGAAEAERQRVGTAGRVRADREGRRAGEALKADIQKKRQPVPHDRTADRRRQLRVRERLPCCRQNPCRSGARSGSSPRVSLPTDWSPIASPHSPARRRSSRTGRRTERPVSAARERPRPEACGARRRSPPSRTLTGHGCPPGPRCWSRRPEVVEPVRLPCDRRPGVPGQHRLGGEEDEAGEVAVRVGRDDTRFWPIVCAGPVRPGFRRGSACAFTTTSASCGMAGVRTKSARYRSPSDRVMPSLTVGVKPMARASTA